MITRAREKKCSLITVYCSTIENIGWITHITFVEEKVRRRNYKSSGSSKGPVLKVFLISLTKSSQFLIRDSSKS